MPLQREEKNDENGCKLHSHTPVLETFIEQFNS